MYRLQHNISIMNGATGVAMSNGATLYCTLGILGLSEKRVYDYWEQRTIFEQTVSQILYINTYWCTSSSNSSRSAHNNKLFIILLIILDRK